ncbi:hypothetical protein OH76DRAFT_1520472 [Lentinus brumalis]|uniref:Uncharacterized protein n=1 Tax=Lentinus brumalis TaxID=2498619 RepID=A0A371D7T0_9APHY|nr:hypothetical protein OH76DRAFT_1520472 [Polyporus brumalis]
MALIQEQSAIASTQKTSPTVSPESFPVVPPEPSEPTTGSGDAAPDTPPAVGHDASLSVRMPQAYKYRSLARKHGVSYDDTFHVTFSSSTPPAWAALLHDCYTILYDKLSHTQMVPKPQTKSDEKENKLVARRPLDGGECHGLEAALSLLDDAITSGIVERLFQPKLEYRLNLLYAESMREKTNPRLASLSRKREPGRVEYHYDADDLQADAEDSLRHIIRHLRAPTFPLRAASSIVRSCLNAPDIIASLKAYQVVVTPDSRTVITGEYFELFREEFASRWGEQRDFVHKALESSKSAVVKLKAASVHAEAALMSLVSGDLRKREVDVSGMPMPIAGLLPPGPIPVGLSERCCCCYWLLDELLKSGRGTAANSALILSGTHGVIFPWQPPPGVPREVLETMRKKLLDILHHVFEAHTVRPESGQTSPLFAGEDVSSEIWDIWQDPAARMPYLTFD